MAKRVARAPGQLQVVRVRDLPTPFYRSKQMYCGGCHEPVWVCEIAERNCVTYVPICSSCQPAIKVEKGAR